MNFYLKLRNEFFHVSSKFQKRPEPFSASSNPVEFSRKRKISVPSRITLQRFFFFIIISIFWKWVNKGNYEPRIRICFYNTSPNWSRDDDSRLHVLLDLWDTAFRQRRICLRDIAEWHCYQNYFSFIQRFSSLSHLIFFCFVILFFPHLSPITRSPSTKTGISFCGFNLRTKNNNLLQKNSKKVTQSDFVLDHKTLKIAHRFFCEFSCFRTLK